MGGEPGRREWIRRAVAALVAPVLAGGLERGRLERRGLEGRWSWPSPRPATAEDPAPPAGVPAPLGVIQELRLTLARAVDRFQAKDLPGVLGYVSEQYWTGPFTKGVLHAQLATIFQLHRQVQAKIRIDDVRLVGAHAWVYTTGDITGQIAVIGSWVSLFTWEKELEVARREGPLWRLYGYQN